MRNFSENNFNSFKQGYSKKVVLSFSNGVTIDNDGIVSEEFSITQTLCDESALTFGKVCPAQLYVKVYDTSHTFKGTLCTVNLKSYDLIGTEVCSIGLGTFSITSDSRTADKRNRELIGYDPLYTLSQISYVETFVNYSYQSSSQKKTFKNFVIDFLDDICITISCNYNSAVVNSLISTNLGNVKVQGNTAQTSLSYLDMLQMICEVLGCFCYLDFNGELRFVVMKNKSNQISAYSFTSGATGNTTDESTRNTTAKYVSYAKSDYFLSGFTYEDYQTANYTELMILADLKDGAETTTNYTKYRHGSAGVTYTIDRNILTKGWTSTQLGYIRSSWASSFNYASISYRPSTLKKSFDPRIELGDYVKVTTPLNEVITFPILKRTIKGIMAIKDELVASGSELNATVNASISTSSGATVGYAQVDLSNIKGACIINSYIVDSTITGSKIANSTLTNAHIVDATIDYAKMNSAFVSNLTSDQAFVNELQTNVLTAEFIQSAVADVGYLRAEYVQADETYSLISTIGQLTAELSLLKDVHITQSGKISGYLDAVEVNANSITAGKLIADYIYLKGENGLLYQFNLATQYSLIDDKPSDWDTNYANYYVKTYSLTANEPDDWETNYYTDYYVSDGQGGYVLVQEQQTVPTWQANTYYRVVYTANASTTWAQNTYYRLNSNPSTTTLDGNAITNRTITADHIVAGTITANEIASGTITADKIGANAVTTDKINANAITSAKISSNAITTDKINALAITGDKIASNTITAGKLNVTSLSAISANLGTITGGSLNINNKFKVTSTGSLTATSGKIAGFSLSNDGFVLYDSDNYQIGAITPDITNNNSTIVIESGKLSFESDAETEISCLDGNFIVRANETEINLSGSNANFSIMGGGLEVSGNIKTDTRIYATGLVMGSSFSNGDGSGKISTTGLITGTNFVCSDHETSTTTNIGYRYSTTQSTAQSIPSSSTDWTALDTTASGSVSGKSLTLAKGVWLISIQVLFAGTTNGGRRGVRLMNKTSGVVAPCCQQVISVDNNGSAGLRVSASGVVVLGSSSKVRIECLQDRGSDLNVNGSSIQATRIL